MYICCICGQFNNPLSHIHLKLVFRSTEQWQLWAIRKLWLFCTSSTYSQRQPCRVIDLIDSFLSVRCLCRLIALHSRRTSCFLVPGIRRLYFVFTFTASYRGAICPHLHISIPYHHYRYVTTSSLCARTHHAHIDNAVHHICRHIYCKIEEI